MRVFAFFMAGAVAACALVHSSDARACGGCFTQQTESTQVVGHRMALGLSQDQTTLYDQIQYSGNPEEFAWVLPIRGEVDVALSSDLLFSALEAWTQVQILSPSINCFPGGCPNDDDGFANGGSAGDGGGDGGVEIISQEVVGPYETVQLTADDPAALTDWLVDHGYAIPASVEPVIDYYVEREFGFLALRLIPGAGISAMRPIAITTPGAVPELPLRMVAAGTGAITSMTLWVVSDGRYRPQNFPSFLISSQDLVWNWDTQRSNYTPLRDAGFASGSGDAWLIEMAGGLSTNAFDELLYLADYYPEESGYEAGPDGSALEAANADLARLFGGGVPSGKWVTRMAAQLPSAALSNDLLLEASPDQSEVYRQLSVSSTTGTEPQCPPPPDCGDDGWSDGWDGGGGSGGNGVAGGGAGCDACAAGRGTSPLGPALPAVLLAVAWTLRRRGRY